MPRVKIRTFSGAMCEQEVFTLPDTIRKLPLTGTEAELRLRKRFENDEDRARHKENMSRRHHARLVNQNFSPTSIYSTLTFDDEHEVHTFKEARRIRDLYVRRLQTINPKVKIMIYMGRGKGTDRIHFHMLSDGINKEAISSRWIAGTVISMKNLRKQNFYDHVDHGQDYSGLADYLFGHWTEEQGKGTHRWRPTKTIQQPDREPPTVAKREYTVTKPPQPPKGYRYIGCTVNQFSYLSFLYTKILDKPKRR